MKKYFGLILCHVKLGTIFNEEKKKNDKISDAKFDV